MGQRPAQVSDFDRQLAEEIRIELARQQQTERWLARQTGISYTYLNMRTRAERPFTANDVHIIAAALHVPHKHLIDRATRVS